MRFPHFSPKSRPGLPGHVLPRTGTAMAVVAACLCLPTLARADFDRSLAEKVAPAVLQHLRDNGYHTVGVLKFRVKRGNEPESFYVGALNDNMVTRLENALIYKSKDEDGLMILQNPSTEAIKQKQHLSYLKPEGRDKLLELSYPLAFGDEHQTAKPDVLLTGLVELNPTLKSATLTIEAFSPKAKDLTKIGSWQVPTDRAILADAAYTFSVKKLGAGDPDQAASESASEGKKADADSPVQVTILYDKKPQKLSDVPGACGEFQVPDPKENQQVVIRLKNTGKERLGIALLVNGINTRMKQQGLPTAEYKRWILAPDEEQDYDGFVYDDGREERFSVLSDAASKQMMETEELSACNFGTFEIYVFREGTEIASNNEEKPFSLGLRAKPSQRPKNLNEARSNINRLTAKTLGVIAPAAGKDGNVKLEVVAAMKNPQLAMSMIVRYYHPKMKKIE